MTTTTEKARVYYYWDSCCWVARIGRLDGRRCGLDLCDLGRSAGSEVAARLRRAYPGMAPVRLLDQE